MDNKKKVLGKGLEQLFTNNVLDFDPQDNCVIEKLGDDVTIIEIPIKDIRSNPYQPRKTFNKDALKDLSESIKEYGVVQPVVVKKSIKGYELVAGERRCKASELAGLTLVPAIIKDFTDSEMMDIALLENVQREDLNPIEIAVAIENIIKIRKTTQEEFALKFGKSRTYITNLLGILKLPEEVKKLVEEGKLSLSHARTLSKIDDKDLIVTLAQRIVKDNLSVHELEKILSFKGKTEKVKSTSKNFYMYEKLISDYFAEKVKVSKNKIEIKFSDEHDLLRVLNLMNVKVDEE